MYACGICVYLYLEFFFIELYDIRDFMTFSNNYTKPYSNDKSTA